MNKTLIGIVAASFLVLPLAVGAMDHGKQSMDHGKSEMEHGKKEMAHGAEGMDHSGHMGENIREVTVDGYQLAYHLIDNMAQMEKMKNMKGMSGHDMGQMKSHHLMLYVVGPNGKAVSDAKVGYKVEGPTDSEQKVMAMGMKEGFGADVEMKDKGRYEIKTKMVAGDVKLTDEFKYTVE